jgi:hypothetical protein
MTAPTQEPDTRENAQAPSPPTFPLQTLLDHMREMTYEDAVRETTEVSLQAAIAQTQPTDSEPPPSHEFLLTSDLTIPSAAISAESHGDSPRHPMIGDDTENEPGPRADSEAQPLPPSQECHTYGLGDVGDSQLEPLNRTQEQLVQMQEAQNDATANGSLTELTGAQVNQEHSAQGESVETVTQVLDTRDCEICQSEYERCDFVLVLLCKHFFHKPCILR